MNAHVGQRLVRPALERMKVLSPRSLGSIVRQFHNKEWWYTGVFDPKSGAYISWYFTRVNIIDKFIITVFDPSSGEAKPVHFGHLCRLAHQRPGKAFSLEGGGKRWSVSYGCRSDGVWKLVTKTSTLEAEIEIAPTIPPFTKFDNEFEDYYAIIHHFRSRAQGTVSLRSGKKYELSGALAYQDHCYGRVPSRTGWHWIAAQNEQLAVTSLVNYGAYSQRYTQAWLTPATGAKRTEQWIRLDQNVSFEREARDVLMGRWQVSSPDLVLEVAPRQLVRDTTRIPPFVNLDHTELFVEAEGHLRVDGQWIETGRLHGVMEQHHGRW